MLEEKLRVIDRRWGRDSSSSHTALLKGQVSKDRASFLLLGEIRSTADWCVFEDRVKRRSMTWNPRELVLRLKRRRHDGTR